MDSESIGATKALALGIGKDSASTYIMPLKSGADLGHSQRLCEKMLEGAERHRL